MTASSESDTVWMLCRYRQGVFALAILVGCRRVLGAVQAGILNMSGDETD